MWVSHLAKWVSQLAKWMSQLGKWVSHLAKWMSQLSNWVSHLAKWVSHQGEPCLQIAVLNWDPEQWLMLAHSGSCWLTLALMAQ
jgi:hypothetical protein